LNERPALARSLPEPKYREFAEEHSLFDFVRKPAERLEFYFGVVRDLVAKFNDYFGHDPPDSALLDVISLSLNEDHSFSAYVKNHQGKARLASDTDAIYRAGAGAILCEYLRVEVGLE
jgi:hypothetical protein